MKFKHLILSILFVSSTFCFAQDGLLENELNIAPVSPGAASLGKYGEIPVNLASGKINYTIPIYTIKVGGFEWPIYLSYNYSGLLVEQDPSMVGLGWDLMAGGRLSREIRGVPDERAPSSNNWKKKTLVPYIQDISPDPDDQLQIFKNITGLGFDGEPDKYFLQAGSLSGSFVYNEDDEVVFLDHRNYLINGTSVIDTEGNTYVFVEQEMGEFQVHEAAVDAIVEVPVSYLLDRIELANNGGTISFEYAPSIRYNKTVFIDTQISGIENSLSHVPSERLIEYKPLQKIVFPNGEIHFNTTTSQDQSLPTVSLNSIGIFNDAKEIFTYDFEYNTPTKSRKVLKNIVKTNGDKSLPYFKMDYFNESELDGIIHYASQDFWGYFNNIPSENLITASREIDTCATKFGALKRIIYPTGGYTTIEYEQNKVPLGEDVSVSCTPVYNAIPIYQKIEALASGQPATFNIPIDVGADQIVRVTASVRVARLNADGPSSSSYSEAGVFVTTNGGLAACGITSLDFEYENTSEGTDGPEYFWQETNVGHTQDGIINITGYIEAAADRIAYVSYRIEYQDDNGNSTSNVNEYVGGIRVSSTTDCDNISQCIRKNYKYLAEDGVTSSGTVSGSTPQFMYTLNYEDLSDQLNNGSRTYRSARSKSAFTSYQGSPALYERVEIVSNGVENGKIVNTYSNAADGSSIFPFPPAVKKDWKKGKLLTSDIFKFQDGTYDTIQSTTNIYEDFYPYGQGSNSTLRAYGLTVGRNVWIYSLYPGGNGLAVIDTDPSNYQEFYYIDSPKEHKLVKTITKSFLSGQVVKNIVEYDYDDFYSQLKSTVATDSRGRKIRTDLSYPYSISGTFHDSLIARNRISENVLAETSLINTDLSESKLSTRKVLYQDFGNGIIDPEFVQISKSNDTPENRIKYHRYDDQGNPLQFSSADGPSTSIIWGYDQKFPVAKIENATYEQIEALPYFSTAFNLGVNGLSDDQLNSLRKNLSGAMVTTYTYDPLVGVTKMTDPRGNTINYIYDEFNRLKEVRDDEDNLVTDYDYSYKQPISN